MVRLLSIDWDRFFPDAMPYDLGHAETIFLRDHVWAFRVAHVGWHGERLLDAYRPLVPDWLPTLVLNQPMVYVAESHSTIWKLIEGLDVDEVDNLDAHHDFGYGESRSMDSMNVYCDNWALKGVELNLIERVRTWYPEWRYDNPEHDPEDERCEIRYGYPEPAEYDAVFMCRSGSWTPPWTDPDFWILVAAMSGGIFEVMDEEVSQKRSPTLKDAERACRELEGLRESVLTGVEK